MKSLLFATLALTSAAFAGTVSLSTDPALPAAPAGFERAIRPISNPTLFDLALPRTNLHVIALHQNLPDAVSTTLGPVAMGGDARIYALQLEYALNERFSIVATKDGYVDFDADNDAVWSDQTGFANLAAGVKYAFLYDPATSTAASATLTIEVPTGNRDVFQGEGDGAANLILSGLKLEDRLQLAGAVGVHLPFDGRMPTTSFVSAHVSYEVSPWFIPLAEVNWHRVLSTGDGTPAFNSQVGGNVPPVAEFEGFDLLHFGASHAGANRDFVSAAIGFRSRLGDTVSTGLAYEIPLTDANDTVMESRITFDLVWNF